MSWETICKLDDIAPNTGAAALVNGVQIAIFRAGERLYAISNHCPFSGANVLARGIIADIEGDICVAAPLYKQHFSLSSGQCHEDESIKVDCYEVRLKGKEIELQTSELKAA